MRMKHAAILAAIGIVLTFFPAILNLFAPFIDIILIGSLIKIAGSIFIVLFFYVFLVKQQETSVLKTAGVLGLFGYLTIIIINISGMISNGIFYTAVKYPLNYMGLFNITFIFGHVIFIVSLIPTVLILACYMIFYKNLNGKSHLKKSALLAAVGQLILLIELITSLVLNKFLFKILYQSIGAGGLSIISSIEAIVGLIPSILAAIFFIAIYKELNSNENRQEFIMGS